MSPESIYVHSCHLLSFSQINGDYLWQPETNDGRSVYRMRKRNLMLYFHGPRRAWAIADAVGSLAPYAYVEDKCVYPCELFKEKKARDLLSLWLRFRACRCAL